MRLGLVLAQVDTGSYISAWKCIPPLVLLLIWGRLMTWADKDAEAVVLPRPAINSGLLIVGIAAFALFLFLPLGFILDLAVLVVVLLVGIGAYLGIRGQKVGLSDLKDTFRNWLRSLFTRKAKEIKAAAGQVLLFNKSSTPQEAPASDDPNYEAYNTVQQILTDPMRKGAERIDVAPADSANAIKYAVDGVAYTSGNITRQSATAAITYLKVLAGLDLNEKRKPQQGTLKISMDGKKREIQIITAGSAEGEFVAMVIDPKSRHALRIEQLGFNEQQLATLKNSIAESTGLVLLAAPKSQGLTSMIYAILRGHDAFLTHIQTVERNLEDDLEGVTQNKIASSAPPAEEYKQVNWVISQEPDVLAVAEVTDSKAAQEIAKSAAKGKRIYVGLRAGNTFDALTIWRKLVGDDDLATKGLSMIIAGRVVRKLCNACKVGYTPDKATLRKLNMDPDKISTLYQARTEPMRDSRGNPVSCDFCHDLHFLGRVGVFEVLVVDEEVRDIIRKGGSVNQLKGIFRKQRSRYLQEQALHLVEQGDTSIQEVLRVLKTDGAKPEATREKAARRPE
ncbi:MAG TPA: ATPase, T2SS/T4P/T4SS family [Tepidisphaeraceae bacterium]|jgi:type II secretory ATPase GspE/PulE/Tfp pilus assembly ATPase PilB-like protein